VKKVAAKKVAPRVPAGEPMSPGAPVKAAKKTAAAKASPAKKATGLGGQGRATR
jgi:hypothetical protein